MYSKYGKRTIDFLLSLAGIIILSPLLIVLMVLIKVTSPGPVFFKQKRVGIHKSYFNILKFRTMRIDTPKDMPTHLLENPDQYITSIGKFLRKTSLDELPQLFNQYDLIELRDHYGANDVLPGLTGWAQVNGRDELEIDVKAKLDGEYCKNLSFSFEVKCFFMTIFSVLKHDGVVEGGTGSIHNKDNNN